jgi:three-Cys-motif partner protein
MLARKRGSTQLGQSEKPILARDRLPARETGAWVHDKKYYFERYLDIFTHGVGKKWNGHLAYADLFSGPGKSVIRESSEEVEGSPLIALRYDFARYVFVDVPEVIATLRKRLKSHPKFSLTTLIERDCNAVVEKIRKAIPANHLTLAFIDPTGLQIQFKTIKRLVEERKVDLLMTIQFGMGIRMNIRQYTAAERAVLSDFMGNDGWRDDVSAAGTISDVSGRILSRYMGDLRKLGFGSVREIPIRSDQNNLLLYFMVLASRHPRGEEFWRKITDIQSNGQRSLNLY